MLFNTAIFGMKRAIDPSLSSTSQTNRSRPPATAPAKGVSAVMKFFITAPFTIVGARPRSCRIQPIIPVVVDLPQVPPIAMPWDAALNIPASNSARVVRAAPTRPAARTSGTVASTAADATRICEGPVSPLPSWGWSRMPWARRKANFSAVRPWSRERSEPSTTCPRARRIIANGNIPLPPIPQKK